MQQPPKRLKGLRAKSVAPAGQRTRHFETVAALRQAAERENDPSAWLWMERFGAPGDVESATDGLARSFRAFEDTLNTIQPRAASYQPRARVPRDPSKATILDESTHGAVSPTHIEVHPDTPYDPRMVLAHEHYHSRNAPQDVFDRGLKAEVSAMYSRPDVMQEIQSRDYVSLHTPEEYLANLFARGTADLSALEKAKSPLSFMQERERRRPMQGRAMLAIASKSPYHAKAAEILRKMGFTPPEEK